MKLIQYIRAHKLALWLSVLYVIFGGIVACSLYPDDPLNGDWWFWGWLVTLPVNLVSFSYRYFNLDYFPVLIIQAIMLVPTFLLASRIIPERNKG